MQVVDLSGVLRLPDHQIPQVEFRLKAEEKQRRSEYMAKLRLEKEAFEQANAALWN